MLPMRFFRNRGFCREPRVARDVLRDVRLDLPAGAVLPDRAGLLAARGRPARSCRGQRCRCSSRRSPARSPAASGPRILAAGLALQAVGLAGSRPCRPRPSVRVPRRPVHPLRDRHGAVLRPGRERRPQRRAGRGGQGVRREERDPRARRRVRRRRARLGLRALRRLRRSAEQFIDGLVVASGSGAVVVALGALAALANPVAPAASGILPGPNDVRTRRDPSRPRPIRGSAGPVHPRSGLQSSQPVGHGRRSITRSASARTPAARRSPRGPLPRAPPRPSTESSRPGRRRGRALVGRVDAEGVSRSGSWRFTVPAPIVELPDRGCAVAGGQSWSTPSVQSPGTGRRRAPPAQAALFGIAGAGTSPWAGWS